MYLSLIGPEFFLGHVDAFCAPTKSLLRLSVVILSLKHTNGLHLLIRCL